jgi:UDP-GlcNAc:undecaprenyl-phosphate GlcNAc-1-phosphate transferase
MDVLGVRRLDAGEFRLNLLYLSIFVTSLLISFFLTRIVGEFCNSKGWVAVPFSVRGAHRAPVAKLGGVAIFSAFMMSIAIALVANWLTIGVLPELPKKTLGWILLIGSMIFALGICEDMRPVKPLVRFAIQTIAACLLYLGDIKIANLPVLFGTHHLGLALGLPLTILWVIGITNALNLLNELDGLAAGSALFSTLVVFTVSIFSQRPLVSLTTLALAGAIVGFLKFNFSPAAILLGEGGSVFIGFLLSALALQGAQKSPTAVAVAIPLVSFGLPILDTILSVFRRAMSGRPIFDRDREQIHHKLLDRGLSQKQVVILLYGVSAIFGLLSLLLLAPGGSSIGLTLAVLGVGIWLGVQQLGYLEFGEIQRVAQRTLEQRRIFVNNLSIRRATESLKSARDYSQVCRILESAFSANDFDVVELEAAMLPEEFGEFIHSSTSFEPLVFSWAKPTLADPEDVSTGWLLNLELVTSGNRRRGTMKIRRLYNKRPVLMDINFLTSGFPTALADALDRTLGNSELQRDKKSSLASYS